MHKTLTIFAAAFFLLSSHSASIAADIQMLPPLDFAGGVCGTTTYGVLFWDGVNPIRCLPGFTGDSGGRLGSMGYSPSAGLPEGWLGGLHTRDVYAEGTVGVGADGSLAAYMNNTGVVFGSSFVFYNPEGPNQTLGWRSASTLRNLENTICQGHQALTRGFGGITSCMDVTALYRDDGVTPIATTIMQACPGGTALTSFDGSNFSCVGIQAAINLGCPAGFVLAGVAGGVPACVPVAPPTVPSCPAGQVMVGITAGIPVCAVGVPSCAAGAFITYDASGQPICTLPNVSGNPLFARKVEVIGNVKYNAMITDAINTNFDDLPQPLSPEDQAVKNSFMSACILTDPASATETTRVIDNVTCRNYICYYTDPGHRWNTTNTTIGSCTKGQPWSTCPHGQFAVVMGCMFDDGAITTYQ